MQQLSVQAGAVDTESVQGDTGTVEEGGLDTARLIYVRVASPLEPVTGVFSKVTSNVIKHAVTIAQKRCRRDSNKRKKKELRWKQPFHLDIHILQSLVPFVDHLSGKRAPPPFPRFYWGLSVLCAVRKAMPWVLK